MSWPAVKWARKQRVGSQTAKAVLMSMALYADDKGLCWPSQETMASEIECSVDSVQRALKKQLVPSYVKRMKRKSSDGRRISDAYQLRLDRHSDGPHSRSCGPVSCGSAAGNYQTADDGATEPQSDAPPNCTVRPKSIKEKLEESSGRNLATTPGGARLVKRLGKAVFESWFTRVHLVGTQDQTLLLQADNRFIADHVEQQFDHKIVECFRPEYTDVVRVRVVVRKDNSPTGGTENVGETEGGPAP